MLDSKRKGRIAVGATGFVLFIGYSLAATTLPAGQLSSPGPGAFPLAVGIAAAAISLIVIIQAALTQDVTGHIDFPRGERLAKSLKFLGATIGLVVLLPLLGQYVLAPIYMVLMIRWLGDTSWTKSLVYGAAFGIVTSWIFIEVFGIPMPLGIFDL